MTHPTKQQIASLLANLRLVSGTPEAQDAIQSLTLAVMDLQVELDAVARVVDAAGVPAGQGPHAVALSTRVLRLKHLSESQPERRDELRARWEKEARGEPTETAIIRHIQCPHCLELGHAGADCPETFDDTSVVPPPVYVVPIPWLRCAYCHRQHDAAFCPQMLQQAFVAAAVPT